LDKELSENQDITKTNIIQHSVWFVNDKIERNFYFFVDIFKEGIMLFDSGKFQFVGAERAESAGKTEKG
jgi:hypothetical protein